MSRIPVPIKDISCQALLSTYRKDIVYHGYLRRRHQLNRFVEGLSKSRIIKWPNSYVVLREGCLYVFKDEQAELPSKASSLYGFSEACQCDVTDGCGNVPWSFKVVSVLELRNNVLFFSAVTLDEMETWITKLREQIAFANGSEAPASGFSATLPAPRYASSQPSPVPAKGRRSSSPTPTSQRPALPPPRLKPSESELRELEYEIGDENDDDDDGDDYQVIEDDDINEKLTDDFKGKLKKVSDCFSNPVDDRTSQKPEPAARTKAPMTSPTWKQQPGQQPTNRPFKPPPMTTKPDLKTKPAPTYIDRMAERKSKQESKEKDVDDDGGRDYEAPAIYEESATYMSNDDYPANWHVQAKPSSGEPMVNDAYWRGNPTEGESCMKSISHDGVYMIRESNEAGKETLIARVNSESKKYRMLRNEEGKYFLDPEHCFDTRTELIRHYRTHPLPRQQSVKLTKPYTAYVQAR